MLKIRKIGLKIGSTFCAAGGRDSSQGRGFQGRGRGYVKGTISVAKGISGSQQEPSLRPDFYKLRVPSHCHGKGPGFECGVASTEGPPQIAGSIFASTLLRSGA